jgi:hypothetical protein
MAPGLLNRSHKFSGISGLDPELSRVRLCADRAPGVLADPGAEKRSLLSGRERHQRKAALHCIHAIAARTATTRYSCYGFFKDFRIFYFPITYTT